MLANDLIIYHITVFNSNRYNQFSTPNSTNMINLYRLLTSFLRISNEARIKYEYIHALDRTIVIEALMIGN